MIHPEIAGIYGHYKTESLCKANAQMRGLKVTYLPKQSEKQATEEPKSDEQKAAEESAREPCSEPFGFNI